MFSILILEISGCGSVDIGTHSLPCAQQYSLLDHTLTASYEPWRIVGAGVLTMTCGVDASCLLSGGYGASAASSSCGGQPPQHAHSYYTVHKVCIHQQDETLPNLHGTQRKLDTHPRGLDAARHLLARTFGS